MFGYLRWMLTSLLLTLHIVNQGNDIASTLMLVTTWHIIDATYWIVSAAYVSLFVANS